MLENANKMQNIEANISIWTLPLVPVCRETLVETAPRCHRRRVTMRKPQVADFSSSPWRANAIIMMAMKAKPKTSMHQSTKPWNVTGL